MKLKFVLFLFCCVGGLAQARSLDVASSKRNQAPTVISWYDVAFAELVYLTESVVISEQLKFEVDSKFKLLEVSGGGGYVPATFYDLQALKCEQPNATSEMLMIRPAATPNEANGLVALTLKPNCQIEIIVENREIGLPSFFTDTAY